MRLILPSHLNRIERLAVKGLQLDFSQGRNAEIPKATASILRELSEQATGFPLVESAQLPDGRYLHINFTRLEIVTIRNGKPKVEKRYGNLGKVFRRYSAELWIRLSGDATGTRTGLVENARRTGNAFKRLRRQLTTGGFTEAAKRDFCEMDKTPLLSIIRNSRPICIRK